MRPVPVIAAIAGEPGWLAALRKSDSGFILLREIADPVEPCDLPVVGEQPVGAVRFDGVSFA